MTQLRSFVRRNHVGLLVILLMMSGGVSYAAGTKLPKNSVTSPTVKNNTLKSADIKNNSVNAKDLTDGSIEGTDIRDGSVQGQDLKDGSIDGSDISNGTLSASDLAPGAADESHVFFYTGNGATQTIWEEPGLAKATMSIDCAAGSISSFAKLDRSPGRAGTYGVEDIKHSTEADNNTPLVGAATVSRLGEVGLPVGGAGFGGSKWGFGQLVLFFQTATKDVYIDIKIALCSARASVTIDHKPAGTPLLRKGPAGNPTCEATGAGFCREGL